MADSTCCKPGPQEIQASHQAVLRWRQVALDAAGLPKYISLDWDSPQDDDAPEGVPEEVEGDGEQAAHDQVCLAGVLSMDVMAAACMQSAAKQHSSAAVIQLDASRICFSHDQLMHCGGGRESPSS